MLNYLHIKTIYSLYLLLIYEFQLWLFFSLAQITWGRESENRPFFEGWVFFVCNFYFREYWTSWIFLEKNKNKKQKTKKQKKWFIFVRNHIHSRKENGCVQIYQIYLYWKWGRIVRRHGTGLFLLWYYLVWRTQCTQFNHASLF